MPSETAEQVRQPRPGDQSAGSRISVLDGVRGLAILIVLLGHYKEYLRGPELLQDLLALTGELGWTGVDLFFALSGFLITRILLGSRDSERYFVNFYARRLLRILPLYYLAVSLIVLFDSASIPPGDKIWYWLYMSNWSILLKSVTPDTAAHFWSLAVEEQFYLVWPLVVWRLSRKNLLLLIGVLCCVAPAWRIFLTTLNWDPEWIYRSTPSRMDTLLMGAGVAIAVSLGAGPALSRYAKPAIWIAALGLVAVMLPSHTLIYKGRYIQMFGFSFVGIIASSLVLLLVTPGASGQRMIGFFQSRVLRTAGKYSYGLYVYHFPLLALARHYIDAPLHRLAALGLGFIGVLLMASATALSAFLSYQLFERHALSLKRYFESVRSSPG